MIIQFKNRYSLALTFNLIDLHLYTNRKRGRDDDEKAIWIFSDGVQVFHAL